MAHELVRGVVCYLDRVAGHDLVRVGDAHVVDVHVVRGRAVDGPEIRVRVAVQNLSFQKMWWTGPLDGFPAFFDSWNCPPVPILTFHRLFSLFCPLSLRLGRFQASSFS